MKNKIIRYLYLALIIFMIRFILGFLAILDMTLRGFLGSILTGLVILFLIDFVEFFYLRKNRLC